MEVLFACQVHNLILQDNSWFESDPVLCLFVGIFLKKGKLMFHCHFECLLIYSIKWASNCMLLHLH